MSLIRRESHPALPATAFEPLGLMRNFMRWDPFRDIELSELQGAFVPAFDIKETASGYVFTADLPGIAQEDLEIQLTGNRLTVSGKREAAERKEGENYFTTERSYGSFCRTFTVPEGIDSANVKAELKNGVLTLTVPKVPEVQPKKISVSAS